MLRGGSSVLYGSDGQSGAVNLLTRKPEPGESLAAWLEGGSLNTYRESLRFNYGNASGGLTGTVANTSSERHGCTRQLSKYRRLAAGLGPSQRKTPIEPLFHWLSSGTDLDTSPSLAEDGSLITNQDTPANTADRESSLIGTVIGYRSGRYIDTEARIAYLDNSSEYYFDFGGSPSTSQFIGRSFNTELQNLFAVPEPQFTLILGVDYEHQNYQSVTSDLAENQQRDQTSFFLLEQFAPLEDLELNGGARFTQISDISQISPDFRSFGVAAPACALILAAAQQHRRRLSRPPRCSSPKE